MAVDATVPHHSHTHAPASGIYGKAGRARCGEIDSLSVALKLGGPVAATGHPIETEKNPRRDKCDDGYQDDASNCGEAAVSGFSRVAQCYPSLLSQTSGRLVSPRPATPLFAPPSCNTVAPNVPNVNAVMNPSSRTERPAYDVANRLSPAAQEIPLLEWEREVDAANNRDCAATHLRWPESDYVGGHDRRKLPLDAASGFVLFS